MIENGIIWTDEQNFINKQTVKDDVLFWFPGLIK
jgi:hypothetical protein